MKDLAVYVPKYNPKHAEILEAFAAGAASCGVDVAVRNLGDWVEAKKAAIFGWHKIAFRATWPKQEVISRYRGDNLIIVESAFVRRGEYYQVGLGGFAGNADFRSDGVPLDRWQDLGIKPKRWQRRPRGPIVVCGQVPRDTQVQHVDHIGWCRKVVNYYARRGEYVLFRPHPKIEDPSVYRIPPRLFDVPKLTQSLNRARCYVTWNSTSGVDAIIAGVPVIAMNPGSMAWPVASHSLDAQLRYPSRRQWLASLAYSQWTVEEMRQGLPWRHLMRKEDRRVACAP